MNTAFKIYVLKICGNCDSRYGGYCQNPKGRVKRPIRKTKACNEFVCWGNKTNPDSGTKLNQEN